MLDTIIAGFIHFHLHKFLLFLHSLTGRTAFRDTDFNKSYCNKVFTLFRHLQSNKANKAKLLANVIIVFGVMSSAGQGDRAVSSAGQGGFHSRTGRQSDVLSRTGKQSRFLSRTGRQNNVLSRTGRLPQ